mgnify:CR=1 FL=1
MLYYFNTVQIYRFFCKQSEPIFVIIVIYRMVAVVLIYTSEIYLVSFVHLFLENNLLIFEMQKLTRKQTLVLEMMTNAAVPKMSLASCLAQNPNWLTTHDSLFVTSPEIMKIFGITSETKSYVKLQQFREPHLDYINNMGVGLGEYHFLLLGILLLVLLCI